jgi:hypothetical protein
MSEKDYTNSVPEQLSGEEINAVSVAQLASITEAKTLFVLSTGRLRDVNNWHTIAGRLLGHFLLTDSAGEQINGPLVEGCLFRIDAPGPGSKAGDGYDWVRVEKIESLETPAIESLAIRVRPTVAPATENKETAHFYSDQATSTFTVTREGSRVTAAVYDRNIAPNDESTGLIDKLRNKLFGSAAILAFSKIQWKSLTEGLINNDLPEKH